MRAQKVYNRGVFGAKKPQTQRYKKFSTQVHRLRASVVDPENIPLSVCIIKIEYYARLLS
jgi:hypothetical protein